MKYWIKNPLSIKYGMAKNYLFQVIIAKQVIWAELGVILPSNKKGQIFPLERKKMIIQESRPDPDYSSPLGTCCGLARQAKTSRLLIFHYNIDKFADITYFLDAISFFHIPLYTILDFGFRIAEFKSSISHLWVMGAKRLRRGQRSFGCIPSIPFCS